MTVNSYFSLDTTVLFPHPLGLPHRRSLKGLVADYLQRVIQDEGKSLLVHDKYQAPESDGVEYIMRFMVKVPGLKYFPVGFLLGQRIPKCLFK